MLEDDRYLYAPALEAPGYLANHTAQVFNRVVDAGLRKHGLSMALLGPLLLLDKQGTLLQRDLVQALGVGQPALVATLAKLEKTGYVTRQPDTNDRRASRLALTEAGKAAAAKGEAILWNVNAVATSGMKETDKKKLVSLLQQATASMKAYKQNITSDVLTGRRPCLYDPQDFDHRRERRRQYRRFLAVQAGPRRHRR